jgi:hypothetical protein
VRQNPWVFAHSTLREPTLTQSRNQAFVNFAQVSNTSIEFYIIYYQCQLIPETGKSRNFYDADLPPVYISQL